jgi:hypothetical protein
MGKLKIKKTKDWRAKFNKTETNSQKASYYGIPAIIINGSDDEPAPDCNQITKPTELLYKYARPDRVDVLERLKIRFTQPEELNDPFECAPFVSEGFAPDALAEVVAPSSGHGLLEVPQLDRFFDAFDGSQREEAAGILEMLAEITHASFRFNFIILSLSDKWNNLLMWSHYTDNHKGLVIGFDASHMFFLGNQWKNGALDLAAANKVIYTNERPQFRFLNEINKTGVFLTKSPEWEYEGEWRMVRTIEETDEILYPDDGGLIYLKSVPPAAIRSVILGAASSIGTQRRVLKAIQSNAQLSHVQVFKAEIDQRSFDLQIKEFDLESVE